MFPTRFSLAEVLVLAGTAGTGGMALLTSTTISAMLKRVQEHRSPVNVPGLGRADFGRVGETRQDRWWMVGSTKAHAPPGGSVHDVGQCGIYPHCTCRNRLTTLRIKL